MKEKHHRILDHPILGYFLLMLFSMILAELVSFIIDDMILAGVIPGYAVTQNILGEERVQASGVGDAVGAVLAIALFYFGFRPSFRRKICLKVSCFLRRSLSFIGSEV